jgi:hypothetical protein
MEREEKERFRSSRDQKESYSKTWCPTFLILEIKQPLIPILILR